MKCGILVPQSGLEPTPRELEACSLNHWTDREAPNLIIRADLGSQQHWEESTESSHIPPAPTHGNFPYLQHPHQNGTFIIGTQITLLSNVQGSQQSFFLWYILYGFGECSLHYSIVQNSLPTLKLGCVPPIHPSSPPQPLWTTDQFTVSTILPFPECHIVGIIQCGTFSNWLLSFSNIHLSFFIVFMTW